MFWKKVGTDFKQSSRTKSVWLISLLIFFTMNVYTCLNAFATIFTTNYGFTNEQATILGYLSNFGTPVIGAILFGLLTDKKTKSPTQSIFFSNILLIFTLFIMVIICSFENNGNSIDAKGIVGVICICVAMIFVGANRSIYWSVLSETKIDLNILGIASGIISIVGFSNNIWVTPTMAIILDANIIDQLHNEHVLYSHYGFLYVYIFALVNAIGSIIISYFIFQNIVNDKIFTKKQAIKQIWKPGYINNLCK